MGRETEEVLDITDDDEELEVTTTTDDDDDPIPGEDRGDELTQEQQPQGQRGGSTVPEMIPKNRFDEALRKHDTEREARIRAEERARILEEQIAGQQKPGAGKQGDPDTSPEFDFDAKEEEYANLLMEGDTKAAAAVRREINTELRRQAEADAEKYADQRILAREAERDFKAAVTESYEKYPFLDSKSEARNADAIGDVVEWRDLYISKGDTPAQALRKAVAKVGPIYETQAGDGDGGEQQSTEQQLQQKLKARRAAALRRNAEAAANQPPPTGDMGAGNRGGKGGMKVDVATMSEEDFEKLPESEKKRLRGDDL